MCVFHFVGGYVLAYVEYCHLSTSLISVMKEHKCITKGCPIFLAHIVDPSSRTSSLCEVDVDVVADYTDVFLDEFFGLPPPCQVEF